MSKEVPFLSLAFFSSGTAALIYQITWQRQLFASFGIDADSVAVIVSCFMAGLGLGALLGGELADRQVGRELYFYTAIEVGLACIGVTSIWALRTISQSLVSAPESISFSILFVMLLLPTSLMGATLPLLGAYLARRGIGVGTSIASLYRANTAGAGLGALATSLLLFPSLTLSETVALAALLNVASAIIVLFSFSTQVR